MIFLRRDFEPLEVPLCRLSGGQGAGAGAVVMQKRTCRISWICRIRLLLLLLPAMAGFAGTPARAEEGGTVKFDLGGGVTLEVLKLKAGTFTMGSPDSEPGRSGDEQPHAVTLTRDFYLGSTPVTVAQWSRFVEETNYRSETETGTSGGFGWNGKALEQRPEFSWRNPGFGQEGDHPVVMVTWDDAQAFLKWMSGRTRWIFVLPWEAQWEYACRAGASTAWWTGAEPAAAGKGIWSKESSENRTHPVASLPANAWGLHMAGNVWEWCADWYGPYAPGVAKDPVQGTPTLEEKPRRVLRGGSWLRPLRDTRSAARYRNDARSRNADNGFRVMSFGSPAGDPAAASPASAPEAREEGHHGKAGAFSMGSAPPAEIPASGAGAGEQTPVIPVDMGPAEGPSAPAGRRGGVGWVPLVILGVLGLWILRRLFVRMMNPPPVAPRTPRSSFRPPAPPPLEKPLALAPGQFLTRRVEDGFWLNAGVEAGTWLNLSWRDEHGLLRERRVRYQPGDDGHFIYTGSLPYQMDVRAEDPAAGVPPQPLPPQPGTGTDFPRTVVLPIINPVPPPVPERNPAMDRGQWHRPSAY